jgi:hypothetical protein
LVYAEINGNGGVYEYFLCTGRQQGLCDLGSLPVHEVEAAVAREFGSLALAANFIQVMTDDIDGALAVLGGDVGDILGLVKRENLRA